jgi:hypothetical protein
MVKIWDAWADANGDLGPFMASNGATGTVKRLIKSQNLIKELKPILTAAECLFRHGIPQFFLTLQNHLMIM